ncbi:glutamate--cysteine ligase-like, partial [Uranotaenia lowii]|uniref:glutamate--cysteine ligase-like n=1 Tax=Uranotaenia lowii TaxID=190385 RepID=UPI0024785CF3
KLREGDIDHLLAQHIAHLFIRDSVSLFSEKVHQNDKEDTDHFENIQSTNWQTMRFKPPPPNSSIGWRVEFRPCEAQLTDFENAAIVCFVVLLTRVILSYQLDFLIPISKVDENMQTSQKRGAVLSEKFWFKKNINGQRSSSNSGQQSSGLNNHDNKSQSEPGEEEEYALMTIDQIINGKGCFPGLVPLINSYLGSMDVDADTHCTIQQYLKLIQKRASGELLTTASWIRKEITEHPEYKQDSVVSEGICYDLLKNARDIQDGIRPCPELLGNNINSKTTDNIPPAIEKHLTKCE